MISMSTCQTTTLISSMNVQINNSWTYRINYVYNVHHRHWNGVVGVDLVVLSLDVDSSRSMISETILISSSDTGNHMAYAYLHHLDAAKIFDLSVVTKVGLADDLCI